MHKFDITGKRIWVAGHSGLVGSALRRRLEHEPCEVLTVSHSDLDLTRQSDTQDWIAEHRPDAIIMAAGKVGGIGANASAPADFLYKNLAMAQNVIHGAYKADVQKLLYLGSSCIYPRDCKQPIKEEYLLSGPLEDTNEGYAIAKIAGLKLCQKYRTQYGCNFISAMPTNLYGPCDNFDPETAHVIPALMHKMHQAKINNQPSIEIWGTGQAIREYLHVDDLADALLFLLQNYSDDSHINVGSGQEYTIAQTANMIRDVVGYSGKLVYDSLRPDGTPRKVLDSARINALGWNAETAFEKGLQDTYAWYCEEYLSKSQKHA